MQRMHEISSGKKGKGSNRKRGIGWMYKGQSALETGASNTNETSDEEKKLLDEF